MKSPFSRAICISIDRGCETKSSFLSILTGLATQALSGPRASDTVWPPTSDHPSPRPLPFLLTADYLSSPRPRDTAQKLALRYVHSGSEGEHFRQSMESEDGRAPMALSTRLVRHAWRLVGVWRESGEVVSFSFLAVLNTVGSQPLAFLTYGCTACCFSCTRRVLNR